MSVIHGKWTVEDIRQVIRSLDLKTGMHGAEISIYLHKTINDGNTLAYYHPSEEKRYRSFCFALDYFDDSEFNDLAAVDVIRHEYGHYMVDELGLKAVYDDDRDHGLAWKTVCGLLNADQYGKYRKWYFGKTTKAKFQQAYASQDVPQVNVMEQISRWGRELPSIRMRRSMEYDLVKKYTKVRVFSVNDRVVHERFGRGIVVDTMPAANKQFLYVAFYNHEMRIVQNRRVYKVINGKVVKPLSKAG